MLEKRHANLRLFMQQLRLHKRCKQWFTRNRYQIVADLPRAEDYSATLDDLTSPGLTISLSEESGQRFVG